MKKMTICTLLMIAGILSSAVLHANSNNFTIQVADCYLGNKTYQTGETATINSRVHECGPDGQWYRVA